MQLLQLDFSQYLSSLRSGSEQPSMSFLLHLLADSKHLSDPEIARIVQHLKDRQLGMSNKHTMPAQPAQLAAAANGNLQAQQQQQSMQAQVNAPFTVPQPTVNQGMF